MSDQPQSGPFQPPATLGGPDATPPGEPPRPPHDPHGGGTPPGPPPAGGPPPTPPAGGPPPASPRLPWENRSQLGFGPALTQSFKLFMNTPRAAYDSAKNKGDYASPVIWVLIFAFIGALIQWAWSLAIAGPITASLTAMMPESARAEFATYMAAAVGFTGLLRAIIFPFIALIGVFIWAAILHLCLMVAVSGRSDLARDIPGATARSKSGFEGTFRVLSYAHVVQIANIVPLVGPFLAIVWAIILIVIGMSSMHSISNGKAVVVVLIPLFLCCACISLALAFGVSSMIGMVGHR